MPRSPARKGSPGRRLRETAAGGRAAVLPPAREQRRQEGRQHRRMDPDARARLRAHDHPRRRQHHAGRHAGAARGADGGEPAHRHHPDPHRAGRPRDAVRARAAVLDPHDRRGADDGHQLLADGRSELLRPQRDPARLGLRRVLPPAGAVRPAAARRRDPEPRLRRGGLSAPRRLVLLDAARAARQLRGGADQPARLRRARPPLGAGQPAACAADRREAACTG